MSGSATRPRIFPWVFIVVIVTLLLAVDGGTSPAVALDRWVGTVVINGVPINFTVLINPGVSAAWEWRFGGVQLASGFLSATVSGSSVSGTLFMTGGALFQPGIPPCNFSGTVSGTHAEGTADPVTCQGNAFWSLDKQ
jgi:hypothetical protein